MKMAKSVDLCLICELDPCICNAKPKKERSPRVPVSNSVSGAKAPEQVGPPPPVQKSRFSIHRPDVDPVARAKRNLREVGLIGDSQLVAVVDKVNDRAREWKAKRK